MATWDQPKVTNPAEITSKVFVEPAKKTAKTRLLRIKDWKRLAEAIKA